jgi:hypothetical protein
VCRYCYPYNNWKLLFHSKYDCYLSFGIHIRNLDWVSKLIFNFKVLFICVIHFLFMSRVKRLLLINMASFRRIVDAGCVVNYAVIICIRFTVVVIAKRYWDNPTHTPWDERKKENRFIRVHFQITHTEEIMMIILIRDNLT